MKKTESPVIDLESDHYFMGEAVRQAARAFAAAETPVGAVVVRQGRIIARAFNQVELLQDATAHAEMLALTQAAEAAGDWRLTDATLYVTKEPCPMCAGAMVLARLQRVVFGEITSGIREAECRELLQNFFAGRRAAPEGKSSKLGG